MKVDLPAPRAGQADAPRLAAGGQQRLQERIRRRPVGLASRFDQRDRLRQRPAVAAEDAGCKFLRVNGHATGPRDGEFTRRSDAARARTARIAGRSTPLNHRRQTDAPSDAPCAALLVTAFVLPAAGATADPAPPETTLTVVYDVSVLGLSIGEMKMEASFTEAAYTVRAWVSPKGIASAITSNAITAAAQGSGGPGSLAPAYSQVIQTNSKRPRR